MKAERSDTTAGEHAPLILFYDGVCGLCNGFVKFILKRDVQGNIHFASLQSNHGKALLGNAVPDDGSILFVVVVDGGGTYTRSAAVFRVMRRLGGIWSAVAILRFIPSVVSDAVYDLLARHRYSWFGKLDACPVPPEEVRARFLDAE